jgi:hypothetical protein
MEQEMVFLLTLDVIAAVIARWRISACDSESIRRKYIILGLVVK